MTRAQVCNIGRLCDMTHAIRRLHGNRYPGIWHALENAMKHLDSAHRLAIEARETEHQTRSKQAQRK